MSQNDFTLANQSFPAFRADLNSALQALASNNSGTSAPSTTFANMWWYDSSNNIMYIRNEDNDAWIKFAELDQTNDKFVLSGTLQLDDGTVSAPALTFNSDTNMGIYRGGTDILRFVTAGVDRLQISADGSISTPTSGISNYRAGVNAGNSIVSGGNYNTVVGDEAGTAITTGDENTFLGYNAGASNTTGQRNVLLGYQAGDALVAGQQNTAIGRTALTTDTEGQRSVAVGTGALQTQNFSSATTVYNTAVGHSAGLSITTGIQNTLIGGLAGQALSDADFNVAIGINALTADTKGNKSVAIGDSALGTQNFTSSTDTFNIAIGYSAGLSVTTGIKNVFIGGLTGDATTDADENVAVGYDALGTNTLGSHSVAIGASALRSQNYGSATNSYNTAVGSFAGYAVTTGVENTLIGGLAGDALTDADRNTAIGYSALTTNTKSDRNTAIGRSALENLNHTSVTSGLNTAIGHGAGSVITTGEKNTIIGSYSGNQGSLDIRTANGNIVLSDGDGNPRQFTLGGGTTTWTTNLSDSERGLSTGSHTIHSDITNNVALFVENSSASPYGVFIDFSDADPDDNFNYFLKCEGSTGAERLKILSDGDVVNHDDSYGGISDIKLKEQITDASSQWNDIKALTIRKYKFKTDVATGDSDAHWRIGVIAQEVEEAGMGGLVKDNPDLDRNNNNLGTTTKSVKSSVLYMKAVKALQEAMTRIETLEQKVATLEGE
jgi:hypothetical protein